MNIEIKIRRNQHGKPADKLEDADTSAVVSSRGSSWLALRFRNGARALVQASPSSCTRTHVRAGRERPGRLDGDGPELLEPGQARTRRADGFHWKLMNQKQTSA